jgi:NADH-quinone oxidoreductase subunit C
MSFDEITSVLISQYVAENLQIHQPKGSQPWIEVKPENLIPISLTLRDSPEFWMDFLNCVSAVHLPETNEVQLVYHLSSIPHHHNIVIKVTIPIPANDLPEVPSVSDLWKAALWHEREAYDLMGIRFTNHPDLRRILMPEDWQGYPLRKDYTNAETYHQIRIEY